MFESLPEVLRFNNQSFSFIHIHLPKNLILLLILFFGWHIHGRADPLCKKRKEESMKKQKCNLTQRLIGKESWTWAYLWRRREALISWNVIPEKYNRETTSAFEDAFDWSRQLMTNQPKIVYLTVYLTGRNPRQFIHSHTYIFASCLYQIQCVL